MRLFETKKLHYGKYLYKLAVANGCAPYFRTEFQPNGDLKYCRDRLDDLNSKYKPGSEFIVIPWPYNPRYQDKIFVEDFFDAVDMYRYLKKQIDYKIRVEQRSIQIYSNQRKMLVDLANKLRQRNIEFWEPDPNYTKILNTSKNIILTNSPIKYEFKITLGKQKGSPNLAKWLDANPQLGKMGSTAKAECLNSGWVKGYYFYVRDKKTLTIAQLLVGDNIQRIQQFIHTDK